MVFTRSAHVFDVTLDAGRAFFQQKREQLKAVFRRHKVYRATRFELSSLSNRDLNDLGIARSSIKHLAQEAAKNC